MFRSSLIQSTKTSIFIFNLKTENDNFLYVCIMLICQCMYTVKQDRNLPIFNMTVMMLSDIVESVILLNDDA